MAYRRVTLEALADELKKIGDEYDKETVKRLKRVVRKSGNDVAGEIRDTAPDNSTSKWSGIGGAYAKGRSGGTFKKSPTSTFESKGARFKSTIHFQDPEYRLAHLLEDGHKVVHPMTGRVMGKGQSEAFHFTENAMKSHEQEIIENIGDAL